MVLLTLGQSVSALHKLNFDLKLKVFLQQQRQAELEERLEAAEARIAEQAEMQAVNEQLLAELEKRDQAVEEAVGIICALEEKIDKLTKERAVVRSYDAQYELDYFRGSRERDGQGSQDPDSLPPQRNGAGNSTPTKPAQLLVVSKSVGKMPSFLSEQSEGAEALRSLYLGNDHNSHLTLPKLSGEANNKDDPEEVDAMDSPRLSVLSESSFLSVYGDKELAIDALDLNDGAGRGSPTIRRHRKSISIEKWVDERAKAAKTSPTRPSASKAPPLRYDQYPSILNVLESPLQRLEKMERKLSRHNASVRLFSQPISTAVRSGVSRQDNQTERESMRKTEMTTFGRQQALPPTPDTISTNTLRRFKNSNDTLGRGAAEEEQEPEERLDSMSNAPSYNSTSNARPHSAGETVTSRREGHGWDTVTQSEVTETNSDLDVELPSSFDPWIAMGREKRRPRVQPPDMFTFGGEDEREWGRDMMFNRDNGNQLPRPRNGYSNNREEEPRSEDTITASSRTGRSTSTYESTQDTIPNTGLGIQSSPKPPERRSSLAHSPATQDKKYRKPSLSAQPSLAYHNGVQASTTTTVYADPVQNNPKRSRITSRLFSLGRSELVPISSSGGAKASTAASNPNAIRNYTDYVTQPRGKRSSIDLGVGIDGLHGSSATPPPIARYPRNRAGVGPGVPRPMSASSLDSNVPGKSVSGHRQRRGYDDGFGVDGAHDERPEVVNGKGDGKAPVRKWFGLGRTGSVRR